MTVLRVAACDVYVGVTPQGGRGGGGQDEAQQDRQAPIDLQQTLQASSSFDVLSGWVVTLSWLTTEAATVSAAAVGPCCCYCWIDSEACRKEMVIAVLCHFARLRGMHLLDDTSVAFMYVAPSPASSSSSSPWYSTREQLNDVRYWRSAAGGRPLHNQPASSLDCVRLSPALPGGVHGDNSLASLAPYCPVTLEC